MVVPVLMTSCQVSDQRNRARDCPDDDRSQGHSEAPAAAGPVRHLPAMRSAVRSSAVGLRFVRVICSRPC